MTNKQLASTACYSTFFAMLIASGIAAIFDGYAGKVLVVATVPVTVISNWMFWRVLKHYRPGM